MHSQLRGVQNTEKSITTVCRTRQSKTQWCAMCMNPQSKNQWCEGPLTFKLCGVQDLCRVKLCSVQCALCRTPQSQTLQYA